jgi:ketosteroid isomerase-like protein
MSQEKLEVVRRGHDAFSRGDLSPLRRIVADDVDWGTTGSFPGLEASYRGPDALETWMDAVRAAWEWFEVTIDDVLRDEGDVLVIRERLRGRGRESGAEVDMRIISVYWFDAGKVVKRRVFVNEPEALEAAALGE